MRKHTLTHTQYVLIGLCAMIAAFPLATATDGSTLESLPFASLTGDSFITIHQDVTDEVDARFPLDVIDLTGYEEAVLSALTAHYGCDGDFGITSLCDKTATGMPNPMGRLME